MTSSPTTWTDALPKESGYYWVRYAAREDREGRDEEVIRVVDNGKRGAIFFRCYPADGAPIWFLSGCRFLRINPSTDEASP